MATLTAAKLTQLIADALLANNTSMANATCVARALAAADADELYSHGSARTPAYAAQSKSGKVNGHATPVIHKVATSALQVDAVGGFAFPALELGLKHVKPLAKETGIAALSIKHSHHSGAIGHHIEELARDGLIGLAFSNAPAAIAPPGGSVPLFGTNPIAFSCPREKGDPLVIDLSLSTVARGKVKLAADRGESIPLGWAVDKTGKPTSNAASALAGSMTAIGDSKGAALALMVEILCAGISDSNFGYDAGTFFTGEGKPPSIAQLFIVIDPSHFASGFKQRVEAILNMIEQQPGTRTPGARRFSKRKESLNKGIEIDDELLEKIITLGSEQSP